MHYRPNPFLANLSPALRGALLRRLAARDLDPTWGQLVLLFCVNLAIQFLWDFSAIGQGGEFAPNALPGALFIIPVLMLAAWAMAALARRQQDTLLLAVAFAAIVVPLDCANLLLVLVFENTTLGKTVPNWGFYGFYAALAWLALATATAAIHLLPMERGRRLLALPLAAILIVLPLSQVQREQALWVRPFDEALAEQELRRNALEREDVFYQQAALLDESLSNLAPDRTPGVKLWFVGAAGYADQDVFVKEVQYVAQLLGRRYGTAERSVLLANNPKTALDLPIASVTSLRLALERVGTVMKRDRDILLLFLSSHGSADHKFALEFGSMRFNALDPAVLRKMLDEAGIKRRVVVVSACYSGGFIDALQSPDTLTITAAAADKTSFGCTNEADFTYFGKAYFVDALAKTDSFIQAFELAKPLIAAREKAEGYVPSDPRISVGANIGAALAQLERDRPAK